MLHEAFEHERYRVRRAALEALVRLEGPQDRDWLLAAANDRSADVRLARARLMQQHKWPEAIDSLVKLLRDERDFSNNPGYLRGPAWSEFRVARTAAHALGSYEQLPETAVTALLDTAQRQSRDPFVACAAIAALANKEDDRISDAINAALESSGIKGSLRHRPLAQAAAWSMFDRAVANKAVHLSSSAVQRAVDDSPLIAGPLLMAAGVLGGEPWDILVHRLDDRRWTARRDLLRVSAIIAKPDRNTAVEGCEPIIARLAGPAIWDDLSVKEQSEV